jgi:predicted membrane chloride channel (bestrophin family)
MAFFLFGVDELAMQLEEPFSILPMQVFCDDVLESGRLLVGVEVEMESEDKKIPVV